MYFWNVELIMKVINEFIDYHKLFPLIYFYVWFFRLHCGTQHTYYFFFKCISSVNCKTWENVLHVVHILGHAVWVVLSNYCLGVPILGNFEQKCKTYFQWGKLCWYDDKLRILAMSIPAAVLYICQPSRIAEFLWVS